MADPVETIVGLVWPLALLVVGMLTFRTLMNRTAEVLRVRRANVEQTKKKGLQLPNSAYELVLSLEKGLEMQVGEIAARCQKAKIDPMTDTGYNTVLEQYKKALSYREKFESNPLYMLADQVGWPIVRALGDEGIHMAKRVMRGIGQ